MSVEGHPAIVDRRGRYGDWKGDTIVGAHRRGGAVTLVERKSGYLLLGKVANFQAATVRQAAARRYATTPPTLRKTLTLDSGKEFAEHEQLELKAALRTFRLIIPRDIFASAAREPHGRDGNMGEAWRGIGPRINPP